ncbi:hypothetical protein [Chloracidobacterium aggregatum]|uniref:Uncharacterized protein n=1 Tax=Chloracidobacterium sp. N TaxID=2821540 RepID=A0ABX8B4K8_9BACT|nr:hypothetical protein [Chloracidobacterium aggregatum]QUV86651.1 hypothetical protein J8C03_13625 [Chloracidobacterium sp. 2]QUV89731.1 hypothetical protein J8C07_13840 [Chloracidobacterium sp. S]QUV92277.1 hypothetical protein J8C04_15365 [Chloracidobacterium sp. A]QUV95552.1 hypothetical protein J8C05_11995 [Chloracidobacterium sp. N]QUV98775.1 hypothetical protein J8C00_13225 [Chloracidobacterium sp. E]
MPTKGLRAGRQGWFIGLLAGLVTLSQTNVTAGRHPSPVSHEAVSVAGLNLGPEEQRLLDTGGIVVRPLPTGHAKTIAAQGLAIVESPPETFLDAYRSLEAIRHGGSVTTCGRFSPVPTLADVAHLPVSPDTLTELSTAHVGDSKIKLSAAEIETLTQLRQTCPAAQLRPSLADAYRQMLWKRALAYATHGPRGLPAYADKNMPTDVPAAVASLVSECFRLAHPASRAHTMLERFPRLDAIRGESFLYWAVQKYGDLKPVTTVVHVLMWQDKGRDYIASTLIYANHYTEAAFVLAELIPFTDPTGRTQTIVVYSVCLQTDLLGGQLGFLKKKFAQSKLLSTLKGGLTTLRTTVLAASRARGTSLVGVLGSAGFQPADQKVEDNLKILGF